MRKCAGKLGAVSEFPQRRGAIQAIRVNKGYHGFTFDSRFFALLEEWVQLPGLNGRTLFMADYLC